MSSSPIAIGRPMPAMRLPGPDIANLQRMPGRENYLQQQFEVIICNLAVVYVNC